MILVEVDVPKLLVELGMEEGASELSKAVGDLCIEAREYSVNGS